MRRQVRGVVGNHGVEAWHCPNGFARMWARWRRQLQSHLAGERGVVVEDRGCSIAIHYRQARRKSETRAAYGVRDQRQVDARISSLVRLRSSP